MKEGQSVGRYRLVRELGRGGMGIVFEAVHVELASRVAIKIIEPSRARVQGQGERFLREARAAARCRHLHAVCVFDVGVHDDLPYIVMELLEGETLAALLAREAPLPPPRIAELFLPVLSAVATAHAAGVVHRDLKPSNIVLARRGGRIVHPVVTDFGISKLLSDTDSERITRSHALLGTIHYMAPELAHAASNVTPQSDQYSIGVMLYEAATARRPFNGSGPYALMHAIVTAACSRPQLLNPDVPRSMEAAIQRAMSPDPYARYCSVRALARALLSHASAKTWSDWAAEFPGDSEVGDSTHADGLGPESAPAAASEAGHFQHAHDLETESAPVSTGEFSPSADATKQPMQLAAKSPPRFASATGAIAAIAVAVAVAVFAWVGMKAQDLSSGGRGSDHGSAASTAPTLSKATYAAAVPPAFTAGSADAATGMATGGADAVAGNSPRVFGDRDVQQRSASPSSPSRLRQRAPRPSQQAPREVGPNDAPIVE